MHSTSLSLKPMILQMLPSLVVPDMPQTYPENLIRG